MPAPRLSRGGSIALLIGLFFVVGMVLALMGGAVLIPQGAAVGVLLAAAAVFLAIQLVLFRLFGLVSDADQAGATPSSDSGQDEQPLADVDAEPDDAEAEWRAWRG